MGHPVGLGRCRVSARPGCGDPAQRPGGAGGSCRDLPPARWAPPPRAPRSLGRPPLLPRRLPAPSAPQLPAPLGCTATCQPVRHQTRWVTRVPERLGQRLTAAPARPAERDRGRASHLSAERNPLGQGKRASRRHHHRRRRRPRRSARRDPPPQRRGAGRPALPCPALPCLARPAGSGAAGAPQPTDRPPGAGCPEPSRERARARGAVTTVAAVTAARGGGGGEGRCCAPRCRAPLLR